MFCWLSNTCNLWEGSLRISIQKTILWQDLLQAHCPGPSQALKGALRRKIPQLGIACFCSKKRGRTKDPYTLQCADPLRRRRILRSRDLEMNALH